jgi:transcriptional regulator with XRE-family HTH domain
LKELLSEHSLTKNSLEAELGLGKGLVRRWEEGTGTPSLKTVKTVADYFGVTTSYLLGDSNFRTVEDENRLKNMVQGKENLVPGYSIPIYEDMTELLSKNLNGSKEHITVPASFDDKENCIAIRVEKDGTLPQTAKDDILIVHKQDKANTNDIILAITCKGEILMGKSIWTDSGLYIITPHFYDDVLYFSAWDILDGAVKVVGKIVKFERFFK